MWFHAVLAALGVPDSLPVLAFAAGVLAALAAVWWLF